MGNEHDHAHEHEHGYHVDGHLHGGDDHSDNIMKHDHCDRDHNPDASFKSRHEAELDARAGARTDAEYAEAMANQRKLKRATAFVLVFFFVEIVGGLWSGSLAIISDAAHLLTDVSGFILTMIANEIATRPACDKFTYGPVRAEVLSALFSTVTILVISLLLVYFAILRLVDFSRGRGEEIDGKMMSFIAALGLLVNMALLRVLGHDHEGHHHGHDHSHAHSHGGHDEHVHDEHEHDESEHGHEYHEEDAGLMEREGTTHGG